MEIFIIGAPGDPVAEYFQKNVSEVEKFAVEILTPILKTYKKEDNNNYRVAINDMVAYLSKKQFEDYCQKMWNAAKQFFPNWNDEKLFFVCDCLLNWI